MSDVIVFQSEDQHDRPFDGTDEKDPKEKINNITGGNSVKENGALAMVRGDQGKYS